jgi:N-hydroxyarylamine O-acetyltransferase
MTAFTPDPDAYLGRLGWTGPCPPTAATLAEIQRRHVETIPFENLDILLGRPIRLDPAAVERKLVTDKRGGYCFEQNLLLQLVLGALGFTVTPLSARVRWQVPPEVPTPLTHMILRVEAGGRSWLVDGGFGSASLSAPLRLDLAGPQPTPHEPRRLLQVQDALVHQTRLPSGEWADLYRFTPEPQTAADYAVANWWTSTHPDSRFTQNLVTARSAAGCRHTIFNREFTTRWTDGRMEQRILTSPAELREVLAGTFGLHFPADTLFKAPALSWSEPSIGNTR